MKTLLLEIGTEEIPARFTEPEKEGFLKLLQDGLTASRLFFGDINIQTTPRRIAAMVANVAEKQEETTIIKFGPPLNRAYDESGNPTKAATGFAKSQGVAVEDLKRGVKDGVEFITVEKLEAGRQTIEILPDLLQDIIAKIPYQKKMRWGAENFEFARPIQWLLALFGDRPIKLSIADVKSGTVTYGHRFLATGPIEIKDPSEYFEKLKANYIIVNEAERMKTILDGIDRIEKEIKGKAIRDQELVKEILYITEYPYPLRGGYDKKYLTIPKEVLVNVMKSHQRYIPIEGENGELLPYFIFFANTIPKEDTNVIRGNEKVLRARLADAQFFFEEDKKVGLLERYERLSSIIFHVKLGTLKDKTDRVMAVARYISTSLNLGNADTIERAVRIMKTDLLTHMVGEFPELQGTMGRIYARIQGEDQDIAKAIEEHYLPTGGNGSLPETIPGSIAGIADKVDSLVSFFSVGITPTGNLDPYALRRQTLGVIKIAINKGFHISLEGIIKASYESGNTIAKRLSLEETKASLTEFVTTRFKFAMIDENHNQDFVESVLPYVAQDIYDGYLRLLALETQQSMADFERLMVGFRRVYNITKQLNDEMKTNPQLFSLKEEEALYNLYESKKNEFFSFMAGRRYDNALAILVSFKETIDNFFDKVFVMDKDESVKNNRLALLQIIKDMFLKFADFSKIRIE